MNRALALLLVLACAPAPGAFAVRFAEGQRAQTAGRHEEAARAYDQAAHAANAPPRDRQYAAYLAAMELVSSGDVAGGAAQLDVVARSKGEFAPGARYAIILLHLRTRDPDAPAELDDFVRRYPNDGLAYPALQARLRLARDQGGEAAALDCLRALAPAVAKSESADRVAFDIAESLAALGQKEDARDAFLQVATKFPYPRVYFDDALYRASEIDEALGNVDRAVADLERMLAVLESSTWPGTYIRPRFPDARWRIATLYRDKLGDKKKAAAAFEKYTSEFPNDVRRGEALWEEAKLLRALGDEDASCDRLARIVKISPDSRYVPCVVERCRTVERPKESHAPKECRAYIERAAPH